MENAHAASIAEEEWTAAAVDSTAIEGATNILGQLLRDGGHAVDRGQLRRVVREAAEAHPGDPRELWWRWIGEAAIDLGLKCRAVDCTFDEFCTLAAAGTQLIVHTAAAADPWRAVTGARGRKYRLALASAEQPSRWGSESQLREFLGAPDAHARLRCLIIERPGVSEAASGPHEEISPLARLWVLLRPERSDIWVLVIFAFVVGLLTLAIPIATQSLIDAVAFGRMLQPVVVLTLILLVFLGFSAALQAVEFYVAEILQCRLFARVTADLSFRLPRVRSESQDEHYMPELVNRFFDIVTVQKVTAKLLLDGLTLILNSVIGMAVLALYHPWLLGYDVVLLAMIAVIIFVLGRGAVATSIKESKNKYSTAAWLEDVARCPLTFKYDGGGQFALERADRLVSEYLLARKKHFRVLMRQMAFALSIQAIASAVLLGVGGWLVMAGQLTLGQLVASELIVAVIVGSFAKLGTYMEMFYDLLASVDKLGVLLDLPIEHQEGMLYEFPPRPLSVKVQAGASAPAAGRGVAGPESTGPGFTGPGFTGPGFTGPGSAGATAAGSTAEGPVHWQIDAGERVAVVGAGCTALLDAVFALHSPHSGQVLIEGIDPRDVRTDFLRHRVALVRGIEVFQGSVAENVHLGRPHVTSHAVRDALEQVGVLESVLNLPDALETELTSDGAPLGESEVRRLMLARAIVGCPGLLLIDHTLDALADDEAAELMRTLCDRRQPWTLLIATGRRALQRQCGRVVEPLSGSVSTSLGEEAS